ncbi:hypothetical protein EKN91_08235 [Enterobacter hormaechei]|nr:hypothetical protein EKN91_08235 [Enterobacter hormaechei]
MYTRRPPGRSIRPYFTKLLTILKQQTAHEFSLSPVTSLTSQGYQKKAGRLAGFSITSPGGECRSGCC